MQTTKPGQAPKGSASKAAPLAFQLSSPTKLVKHNVLAAARAQVVEKTQAVNESEDQVAASVKARAKRSRWGPDQPTSSSPSHTGKAWPPASGFKGVNSHRPPGALLPSRPAYPASVAPTQTSEQHHIAPQSDPAGRQHSSSPAHQSAATSVRKSDILQPSQNGLNVHAGQSGRALSHGGSDRTVPMHDFNGIPARRRSTPPTDHAVARQESTQSSAGGNAYLEAGSRLNDREKSADGERARHTPSKYSRPRDTHKSQLHMEAEENLRTGLMSTDRSRGSSREYHASRAYNDDSRQDVNSKAREPDRRGHMRVSGRSSSGSRHKQDKQHRQRSRSHEEEGQIMEGSSDRPVGQGPEPKQQHQQLDVSSSQMLPVHKRVVQERPGTSQHKQQHAHKSATDAAAAVNAGTEAAQVQPPALQQAHIPDERLTDATANAQPLQAMTTDGSDSAKATGAEHESVLAQNMVTHVGEAAGQLAQPGVQTGRLRSPPARTPRSSAGDPGRSRRVESPSRKVQHMTPASSQESPSSQQNLVTPSRSRQAMDHPRRRRHFHDEPGHSRQPSSDRKRSHTPELEPATDTKRTRHDKWQPASRSVRYAEHHRPPQPDSRHDVHHNLSSSSTKQEADKLAAYRHHRVRDSSGQALSRSSWPDHRHADALSTGQRAHSERSISTSPHYSYGSNQYAEHLPCDRAKGSPAASHKRTWNPRESTVRANAHTSARRPFGCDLQHDQHRPSWSHAGHGRASDMRGQHEAFSANFRAQQLESEMDHMLVGLLSAYEQPAEAIGAKQVLQQMSKSLKLTECIEDGNGQPAFIAAKQSLPGWMSDAERQQIVKMLVPADWLTQDPDYQPQCILPLGWRPPECCSEASCLHVESPDDALRDVMDPDAIADFEACPVQIPWHDEEAEAGELGQGSSKEPRDTMSVAQPAGPAVLPLPLFPFLPEGEAPWPASPYPSQDNIQGIAEEEQNGKFVDQLAPGGFLYDYWGMDNRPPSPSGSWSTSPSHQAYSGWGGGATDGWAVAGHLEPPAAPRHTTNTEQQYTDHVTTTALPHWPEMTDAQQVTAAGSLLGVQQQPHWQQQQEQTPHLPSQALAQQTLLASQLRHPGQYPDPESAHYHLQSADSMSRDEYGLVQLRTEMMQGKRDALQGMSLLNKADEYWIPLQQGHWNPEHLHWEGIGQMLMQGAAASEEALSLLSIQSESDLDFWLAETASSCQQRMLSAHQAGLQTSGACMPSGPSMLMAAGSGQLNPLPSLHTPQASQPTDGPLALLLDSSMDSQQWFDKLDLAIVSKSEASTSLEDQADHGNGGRTRIWGPPPPPQYPAMLRGELALAVMSGVAGKSLLKEVLDRAIQQQMSKVELLS